MTKAFKVKLKAFFIIFEEISVPKNCLRPECVALIMVFNCQYLLLITFISEK